MSVTLLRVSVVVLFVLSVVVALRRTTSRRFRVLAIVLSVGLGVSVPALFAVALMSIECNSYYNSALEELIDETIEATESGDTEFLARLKRFRASQKFTYESRDDVLNKVDLLRSEGKRARSQYKHQVSTVP